MKNPRKTLFYIFLAYNLILFITSIYVDTKQDDLGFLLNAKSMIPWVKYFTFFGLVLFLIFYVVYSRDLRLVSKEVQKTKDEHTVLKAKLFDLQEQSSSAPEVTKEQLPPADSSEEPKDSV